MSRYETIRLPLRDPDGATVHHTLKGEWLVGMGMRNGTPGLGKRPSGDEEQQWGSPLWYVVLTASGKLVVYKLPIQAPPSVAIYSSFEEMQANIPPSIYDEAAVNAGLKQPPQFREVPLEGV
jgi:hypothetical protein